jgi:hypothetical protein
VDSFNIEHILTFPIKKAESRKNFLIGILVYFAGFIIPILPMVLVMGYVARIMRQVINGDEPHMPAWDDWESMLRDGARIYGVRIVYTLPLFVIFFPLFIGSMGLPFWMDSTNNSNEMLILLPILLFGLMLLVIVPLTLALGIVVPAAEAHTIAHNEFGAGFRIREWWRIFRANFGGFIIAYLVSMVASLVLTIITQIAMATIILICVLPLIFPATMLYIMFVMYTAFAQAYRDGKNRISQ